MRCCYLWALLAVVFDSSVFGGNVQPHDDLRGEQLHALGTLVMGFHVGNPPDGYHVGPRWG